MDTAYFVGLIIGVDEFLKRLGVPARILPIISIILAILLTFTIESDWKIVLIKGLETGLIATGIYSGGKNAVKYVTNK